MKRLLGVLLALLVFWALPAGADEAVRERLLRLKTDLSDIHSISGDFVQEKSLDFLAEPIVSRGTFYFAKPDFLLWEYGEPAPSGLSIENGQIESWTGPPKARVQQPRAMAEAARLAAGQVMLWMNLDPEAILAAYELAIIQENPLSLKVIPRREGARKLIEYLTVEFSPDGRVVRQVLLQEAEGQTTLRFSGIRLNRPRPAL